VSRRASAASRRSPRSAAFWLGGRLLRWAGRSGGAPERLLGLHLLLAIGLGSLLLTIAATSAYAPEPLPPLAHTALAVGGNLATIADLMAALWFNYRVFHDGQPGGRVVAVAASLLMWAGFLVYVQAGGMQGADLYGRASWPYVASMVLGDLWLISGCASAASCCAASRSAWPSRSSSIACCSGRSPRSHAWPSC
jgi:hypothetical protein